MSYDSLYLSPHLDDAVLSCGGQLHRFARAGQRILVVTAMARDAPAELSPFAAALHETWGLDDGDAMARRRSEDAAACAELAVDFLHWDFLDALYRRHPSTGAHLYPSLAALFAPADPADDERLAELAERLASLPEASRVCVPLGAGRHVDHLLVRRAAERAFGERRLEYYEDYPYARKRLVLWKALGWPWRWRARVWSLNADALAAKCRAIACYESQLGTAFEDLDDMERHVRGFARRVGGERTWWRAAFSRPEE